jgi:O-antigen biosynthesis protein
MIVWTERWQTIEDRLEAIEDRLKQNGALVLRGGGYDRWDLAVRGGLLGNARVRMAVEDHGGGKQLARFRIWPTCSPMGLYLTLLLAVLALGAALEGAWGAACPLGVVALTLAVRTLAECSAATVFVLSAVARQEGREWTTPAT